MYYLKVSKSSIYLVTFSNTLKDFFFLSFKLLTRLRLSLCHLVKIKHSFQDLLNTICSCGKDTETLARFFLQCLNHSNERFTFLNIRKHR